MAFSVAAAAQEAVDSPAKLVSAPAFSISDEDEAAGIGGTLKVAIAVDKSGNVDRAAVYVGPSWPCGVDLDKRVTAVIADAEKAVRKFKFSPAVKNGKPVDTELSVSLAVGKTPREARQQKTPADPNLPKIAKVLTSGVLNGKAMKLAKPAYPAAARAERASGSVNVQVLIGEDGSVHTAQAISGSPLLQWAARSAACESKFAPTTLQGDPVKVSGVVTYNFVP